MRIIGPQQASTLLPLLARLPVGSARIFHQLNELRYMLAITSSSYAPSRDGNR
jgi:hypothetical protein